MTICSTFSSNCDVIKHHTGNPGVVEIVLDTNSTVTYLNCVFATVFETVCLYIRKYLPIKSRSSITEISF